MTIKRPVFSKLVKLAFAGLASVVAAYFIFILFLVSAPHINDYFGGIQFDANRWKSWEEGQDEEEWGLRWRMIRSLVKTHNLVGMSRAEVVDLLGKPDSEGRNQLHYYLGISGHGIDTGTLSLYFDNQGRVNKYEKWHG